ncbi:MAG TPA: hypothetical protein VFP72_06595 [Kineosporiaceae bacterium]|nr:hypothetical protein [Kineosporiaceae bacterium]
MNRQPAIASPFAASCEEDEPTDADSGRTILEYWIPAEDLEAFNDAIVGQIKVVAEFHREAGPSTE